MGWMSFPMNKPVKNWFVDQINCENYEVLDVALVSRVTMYAAVKHKETGEVYCHINLIQWSPKSEYNFSYKPMSEFAGPGVIDCPLRILNLLTPLDNDKDPNGFAREWRKKVKKYWEKRKSLNGGKKVIKTTTPIRFTNGMEYSYFLKNGKKVIAGILEDNHFEPRTRVNLTSIHNHDFEILKNVEL